MATSIFASSNVFVKPDTFQKLSKFGIFFFLTITSTVVCLNAAFNLSYGASQGVTLWGICLTAAAFSTGDFILLLLSYLFVPRWVGRGLGLLAMVGLVTLSIFSAAAFLLGQQYQQENYDIQLLRASIEDDRQAYQQYHKQVTAERIERKTQMLSKLIKEKGGSGAGAIYHYLSTTTGYSLEVVSLTIRLYWAFTFVIAGIALSSILSEWGRVAVQTSHDSILKSPRTGRSPTRDTNTHGEASSRYRQIKQLVAAGELKPSVRSLKTKGMTERTAQKYLLAMQQEGLITRNGQGYHLQSS